MLIMTTVLVKVAKRVVYKDGRVASREKIKCKRSEHTHRRRLPMYHSRDSLHLGSRFCNTLPLVRPMVGGGDYSREIMRHTVRILICLVLFL
jgi:hypothetical protein